METYLTSAALLESLFFRGRNVNLPLRRFLVPHSSAFLRSGRAQDATMLRPLRVAHDAGAQDDLGLGIRSGSVNSTLWSMSPAHELSGLGSTRVVRFPASVRRR